MDWKKRDGLTFIEGLVIAGIVGLMGTLAAIALDSARERARDAKRLADIVRLQSALELYFNDVNAYPIAVEAVVLGVNGTSCLTKDGFSTTCLNDEHPYLSPVPSTPQAGLKEMVVCGGSENAYCYAGTEDVYRIEFELENDNPEASLQKGVNCATESSVSAGVCEAL